MEGHNFKNAGILVLIVVLLFVTGYELYWRSKGFSISYNDDESLWSSKRKTIYSSPEKTTVFIGSSRIKFDLDIPTWDSITGNKAIQLSMVGTSPRPFLEDIANDKNFKGKLIIDVTEGLFFGRNTKRTEKSAVDGIEFYKKWTPAQKFSGVVNNVLESGILFLEKNKFSLNSLLDDLPVPKRKGVVERPVFPKAFSMNTSERQSFMDRNFLVDTSQQNNQINNWRITGSFDKTPGISGDSLTVIFNKVKSATDKIRARGGVVFFVRTPSSGGYLAAEKMNYPRQKYWDSLLIYTNCQGVYFEDYPAIAHFQCPEWSHLTPQDAIVFTKNLIDILEEKGWSFPNNQKTH
ncbi:MAG: hypothetical protein ABJA57_04195 [Ginsengibacter sp.]